MSDGPNATERRNYELSVLNAIARELNRSVALGETLGAALSQAAELLDLRTGWVWLLSEETGEPYLAASQNLPSTLSKNPLLMEGRCYCLDTYEAGDLAGAANVNVVACSRMAKLVGGAGDGLKYHASVPLYAPGGKRLGVMNVVSPGWRRLSAEELRLLYTVGDLLSIAVERSRLFERAPGPGPPRSEIGWPARSTTPWPRDSPPRGCNSSRPTPCWRAWPTGRRRARQSGGRSRSWAPT